MEGVDGSYGVGGAADGTGAVEGEEQRNDVVVSAEKDDDGRDGARDADAVANNGDDEPQTYEDWTQLDETVLEQLKRNPAAVVHLEVSFNLTDSQDGFDAFDVSWESDGGILAANTHLKSLRFDSWRQIWPSEMQRRANYKHFIAAVARNRSIKHLFIGDTIDRDGDLLFPALDPFFENNVSFRSIEIGDEENVSGHNMDSRTLTAFANAVGKSRTITKFVLLGGGVQVDADAWGALSRCLSNLSSSLVELNLKHNAISATPANAIRIGMMTNLRFLELKRALDLTTGGLRAFFNGLKNCHSLEFLDLSQLNLDDDDMAPMVDALGNLSSLKWLSLHENSAVSATGWQAFASALQNPNCKLHDLDLVCYGMPLFYTDVLETSNEVDDSVVIAIAEALASNSSLKTVHLGRNHPNITEQGWTALANVLCDKTSIEAILASNHTLEGVSSSGSREYVTTGEDIFWRPGLGGALWGERNSFDEESQSEDQKFLVSCLRLNEDANKVEVARKKIILYHFSNGDDNVQDLHGWELGVMPHVMAWIGKDDAGRSLFYRFVQSAPSLIGVKEGMASKATGGKRKRRS